MDVISVRTGHRFYRVDPTTFALLKDAFPDVFERIVAPTECPAPGVIAPIKESWSVGPTGTGMASICYTSKCREVLNYTGHPDGAKAAYKLSYADLPDHILAQYRALYNRTMGGSVAREANEGPGRQDRR